jgi:hypothetical protein
MKSMYLKIQSPKSAYEVGGALRRMISGDVHGWAGDLDGQYLEFQAIERVRRILRAPPFVVKGRIRQVDAGSEILYRPTLLSSFIWAFALTFGLLFYVETRELIALGILVAFWAVLVGEFLQVHLMLRRVASGVHPSLS